MSQALNDLDRRLANIIRIGVVTDLDAGDALVKVDCGELDSEWIPWGAARAGTTRRWSPPSVGEQVLVFSPSGELADAVAGPSIYQNAHPAPASSADQDHTIFPDGSTVDYNSATNTLTVTVVGAGNVVVNCKQATVKADTGVTLDSPETICTGNLTIQKALNVQGTGVSGPVATVSGGMNFVGGAVTHNGKNIGSDHHHSGVTSGGATTGDPV